MISQMNGNLEEVDGITKVPVQSGFVDFFATWLK